MSKEIMFSIVVPVLNEEKYISHFLLALNRQTQKNFEVIVVDNGSTDKTLEVIKNTKSKVDYDLKVEHCNERGISYARNFGAKKAKHDYVVFFDCDCVPNENWIKLATEIYAKNPITKAIGGIVIYSNPKLLKFLYYNIYTLFAFSYMYIGKKVSGRCHMPGNNMSVKKDFFLKVGGFPHVVGEDVGFTKNAYKLITERAEYVINYDLIVMISSRRFEKKGMIKTLLEWSFGYNFKKNSGEYKIYR